MHDAFRPRPIKYDQYTGLEGPIRRLRTVYTNQAEAKAAAVSEGNRLGRATGSGSLTIAGTPEMMADTPILIRGVRKEIDGEWRAASVEHSYDETYITTIELEAPEKGKK